MGQQKENFAPLFDGKPYTVAMNKLIADSVLRDSDLDARAVRLLDALAVAGRVDEAIEHLTQAVRSRSRQQVSNWRGYVYTLLKTFDKDVYSAMKSNSSAPNRAKEVEAHQSLGQGDLQEFCKKHGIGLQRTEAQHVENAAAKTNTV